MSRPNAAPTPGGEDEARRGERGAAADRDAGDDGPPPAAAPAPPEAVADAHSSHGAPAGSDARVHDDAARSSSDAPRAPAYDRHDRAADDDDDDEDEDEDEDEPERWDADDERRRDDSFAPPQEPCECYCLHCGRTFTSNAIWFQRVIGDPQGFEGFWRCPTPNCGGAGFTFDIFPTDPLHPANEGWHSVDDEEEETSGESIWTPSDVDEDGSGEAGHRGGDDAAAPTADYDPDEPGYKELDELFEGDEDADDDDLEGEEWKYGLEPGERPPRAKGEVGGNWDRDEEERMYDLPDERPRELDWSNRDDRHGVEDEGDGDAPGGDAWKEDDIPF